ncbi:Crp/Fnr family transcriptional regulator, partial [Stappia sp.]|uniref:Crp/Fnr family transcriptional regulator n=1 Tax=Stappia sp. TaxID=1870903 RepID=UPI003A9A01A9
MVTSCEHCPLRQRPLFVDCTDAELEFLKNFKVGEMSVSPGTPLLSEGTNTPQVFTVLSGLGLRYKLLENGRRHVVSFVFPGDFLGLQAGVMSEMCHSVEATTAMTLCVFDRSELWALFRHHPGLAFD